MCAATLTASVSVGGAAYTKEVSSGRGLEAGEHSVVQCSEINPSYQGAVWLVCGPGYGGGTLTADTTHCFEAGGDGSKCTVYKKALEATYVKAYVALVRNIADYEALLNNADCSRTVYNTCLNQNRGNYEKLEQITGKMGHLQQILLNLKTRFAAAQRAETKLQNQVEHLTKRCHSMDETVSCLGKIRDAIHILGLCPGLGRPEFKIPVWTGTWVTAEIPCSSMTDAKVDEVLNGLCAKQVQEGRPARAAECSEIEEKTIENMPTTNTARVPLLALCPNCEGDDDAVSGIHTVAGHQRKCWDPEVDLCQTTARRSCATGLKAVLCVYDRSMR